MTTTAGGTSLVPRQKENDMKNKSLTTTRWRDLDGTFSEDWKTHGLERPIYGFEIADGFDTIA